MKLAAFPLIAILALPLLGQNEAPKIILHVASVAQGEATDFCTTGGCAATRFTLGAYADDDGTPIEYVLDCVETIANDPKPHVTMRCPRVHSHKDYEVMLTTDAICFTRDTPRATSDQPFEACYTIKSEKEVQRTENRSPQTTGSHKGRQ
jgi:hypothetical protein